MHILNLEGDSKTSKPEPDLFLTCGVFKRRV
jgi:hypothetical protein